MINQDAQIKKLRSTHRHYDELLARWQFFETAYQGGPDFANIANLHRHPREHIEDFKARAARLDYLNYCQTITDFFTNFIFNDPITREVPSELKEFIADVSLRSDPADKFMKEVSTDLHIYGESFILVEAPQKDTTEVISKLDASLNNIRPYGVLVKPYEILDWAFDKFGRYTYVKRFISADSRGSGTYYEYTPELIQITEIVVNDTGPAIISVNLVDNEIGVIPFVHCVLKEDRLRPGKGVSFLNDLAYNNKKILNISSMIDDFLSKQCFNFLAMEDDSSLDSDAETLIGESNLFKVPAGANFPKYIAPEVRTAQFLSAERAHIKNEMFTRAAQDAMKEMFNGTSSSGFSQAQSFYKTIPFISSRAEILENAELEMLTLASLYLNKPKFEGSVKYKDRYEITALTDAITQLLILARDLKMPSESFIKHQLKRLAKEYDGKMPADVLTTVMAEIDKMNFDEWSSDVLEDNTTSPGAQQKSMSSGTMSEISSEATRRQPAATNVVKN